jgi:hypothetical protein
MSKKSNNYIKSTSDGRLYIKTEDFFRQQEIKDLIEKLMDSKLFKEIKSAEKA